MEVEFSNVRPNQRVIWHQRRQLLIGFQGSLIVARLHRVLSDLGQDHRLRGISFGVCPLEDGRRMAFQAHNQVGRNSEIQVLSIFNGECSNPNQPSLLVKEPSAAGPMRDGGSRLYETDSFK